jgi:hypothetical protein
MQIPSYWSQKHMDSEQSTSGTSRAVIRVYAEEIRALCWRNQEKHAQRPRLELKAPIDVGKLVGSDKAPITLGPFRKTNSIQRRIRITHPLWTMLENIPAL